MGQFRAFYRGIDDGPRHGELLVITLQFNFQKLGIAQLLELELQGREDLLAMASSIVREARPGDYVALRVIDTGTGISAKMIKHVFEPIFTTKDVGQGSGLGLSMVYGLVQQSGGFASLESEEGKGTTVSIYLPTAQDGWRTPVLRTAVARRYCCSRMMPPSVMRQKTILLERLGWSRRMARTPISCGRRRRFAFAAKPGHTLPGSG